MSMYTYSQKEEAANAITHGFGVVFSVVALIILWSYALESRDIWKLTSVFLYGLSMFIMYLSSTIVHLLPPGKWKDYFLILDHSSIFLFIAGTYTPITLVLLKGTLGWLLFGTVWAIALFGILFKIIFLKKYMVLTTSLYLLLGWFIVFAWEPLTSKMAYQGIALLVIGGLCYSFGTIFYLWRGFPYHHAVWHLFVLLGSTCHFFTIYLYIMI